MSTRTPPVPTHRHTRSVVIASAAAASQNPQNPHHLNLQAHNRNLQSSMDQCPQPATPPRTPRKPDSNASTQHMSAMSGSDSVSKQKSKGKNRPKNVMTSPAALRNDRRTPPLTSVQSANIPTSAKPIPTPSTTAYAGPTFHASPAPSSLPIPSFYSKSVPDSPGFKELQARKGASTFSGNDSPTPSAAQTVATQPQREASPLDLFFRADREEKARARNASPFHISDSETGPLSPPSESDGYNSTAAGQQGTKRSTHFAGGSTSALFAMELDGTNIPGKPYGPAFSTPYNERIRAARSNVTSPQSLSQTAQEQPKPQDQSEALKAYLFSTTPSASPSAKGPDRSSDTVDTSPFKPRSDDLLGSALGTPCSKSVKRPPNIPYRNTSSYSTPVVARQPPLGGPRSSGLRREVTPDKTPGQSLQHVHSSYPTPLSSSRHSGNHFSMISPGFAPNCSTSYPSVSSSTLTSGNSGVELKEMEDSLRRILKLDVVTNPNIQSGSLGNVPPASVSTPNLVGSQPSR